MTVYLKKTGIRGQCASVMMSGLVDQCILNGDRCRRSVYICKDVPWISAYLMKTV